MALAWILTVVGKHKEIIIRCPNKLLLEQDRFAMKEIQEAAKTKGTKVVFQKGLYCLGKS